MLTLKYGYTHESMGYYKDYNHYITRIILSPIGFNGPR